MCIVRIVTAFRAAVPATALKRVKIKIYSPATLPVLESRLKYKEIRLNIFLYN